MKKIFLIAAMLLASGTSQADGRFTSLVNEKTQILNMTLDTCVLSVQTVYIQIRSKEPPEFSAVDKCIERGRDTLQSGYSELKETFGKKKVPPELNEWKLEWMSAFDGATPGDSDTERLYLQRVSSLKRAAERAKNKLLMSQE